MKTKLRKICVNDTNFLWNVVRDDDALAYEFVSLRIWIPGQKAHPWVTIHYRYHDHWLFCGKIVTATFEEARKYFQLEPVTPKKVSELIAMSMKQLKEKYADSSINQNVHFNLSDHGDLVFRN
jgi:hypothetical protein